MGVSLKVINSICTLLQTILRSICTLNISYLSKKLNENISEIFACVLYRCKFSFTKFFFLCEMCLSNMMKCNLSNVLAAFRDIFTNIFRPVR